MDKERARELRYRRQFDISIADYDKILEFQGGKCAICGALPKTRRLALDHLHKTGELRGLLCVRCNRILGETVDRYWLLSAYCYIENTPASMALGRTPMGRTGRVNKKRKRGKKDKK